MLVLGQTGRWIGTTQKGELYLRLILKSREINGFNYLEIRKATYDNL